MAGHLLDAVAWMLLALIGAYYAAISWGAHRAANRAKAERETAGIVRSLDEKAGIWGTVALTLCALCLVRVLLALPLLGR